MFKEEHPYRTVTSWVEKIWSWCPCACIPFELRATPLGLLGLGRGVLQAIWDKSKLLMTRTFHLADVYRGASISHNNQPG